MPPRKRPQWETRRVVEHRTVEEETGDKVVEFLTEWADGSFTWITASQFNEGNAHLQAYLAEKMTGIGEGVPPSAAPVAAGAGLATPLPTPDAAAFLESYRKDGEIDKDALPAILEAYRAAHVPPVAPVTPAAAVPVAPPQTP